MQSKNLKHWLLALCALPVAIPVTINAAPERDQAEQHSLLSAADPTQRSAAESSSVYLELQQDPTVLSLQPVNVNSHVIDGATDSFNIVIDSNGAALRLTIDQSESYWLDSDYSAWAGTISSGPLVTKDVQEITDAVFVRNGERVFGQFTTRGRTYELRTSDSGDSYLLIERDMQALPNTDDTPKNSYPVEETSPITANMPNAIVRVLQVATPQAVSSQGGRNAMRDLMSFYLAQSNQVYANTQIPVRVRNAGQRFPSRNEPNVSPFTLIDLVSESGDGFYDEIVNRQRNNTRADVVGFIARNLTNNGLCGLADGIGVGQSEAYFLIDNQCTNFTFVHEIGHLFGARHDNDPNVTPFRFGHGFVSVPGNFRTVMAVSSNPQPRIAAFSSPSFTLGGRLIGNASFRDNTRVHRIRGNTVAGFR